MLLLDSALFFQLRLLLPHAIFHALLALASRARNRRLALVAQPPLFARAALRRLVRVARTLRTERVQLGLHGTCASLALVHLSERTSLDCGYLRGSVGAKTGHCVRVRVGSALLVRRHTLVARGTNLGQLVRVRFIRRDAPRLVLGTQCSEGCFGVGGRIGMQSRIQVCLVQRGAVCGGERCRLPLVCRAARGADPSIAQMNKGRSKQSG